ncbi:MAG TPA: STAS domain-containing protein [Trebonia sp.]|nr:STAS domain-containing protein [Trebonia sp.]
MSWHGAIAVVRLPAEVDLRLADSVRESLLTLINEGAHALIVDMTGTEFCDSAGMHALIRASQRAAANKTQMRIAIAYTAVLRVLELTAVDRLLDVHPDVSSAIASLPDQPVAER